MITTTPSRPRVLVIDDDAAIRAMLEDALSSMDCTVMEAASGPAGLAAFEDFQPDVILLDALMPGMDGFTTCGLLRALPDGDTVPILIVTALDDSAAIDRAFAAGATDFITKPFRLTVLQHRVHRLAEAGRAQQLLHVHNRAITATTNGVLVMDARHPDNPIISVNPAVEHMTGYTAAQLVGRNCRLLQGPGTDSTTAAQLEAAIAAGQAIEITILNYRRDGTPFWNHLIVSPVRNAQGYLTHFVAIQQDITEQKQAEAALQESEERFRGAFEFAGTGMVLCTLKGDYLQVNPAFCTMLGYTEAEMLATTFQLVTHPDDLPADLASLERLLAGEIANYQMEKRYIHKEGQVIWAVLTITLVHDATGRPRYTLAQIQDITSRKATEEALHISEERYRTLIDDVLDTSRVGVVILDAAMRVVWVNRALEDYFGVSRSALIGHEKPRLVQEQFKHIFANPEAFADHVLSAYRQNGHAIQFECHVLPRHDRDERWLEHWSQPIVSGLYAGGRIEQYTDVTARRQAETMLRAGEERFRLLFEHSPDAIWLLDPYTDNGDARIAECNEAAAELHGYTRDELIGQPASMLIPDADSLERREQVQRDQNTLWHASRFRGEDRHRRKDGTIIDVEFSMTVVTVAGRELILSVDRDITARKQMEQAVRASEERFRLLFEHSPDAIWLLDPHDPVVPFPIVDCNPAACEMHGYTREELIGQPSAVFAVAPDDPERLRRDAQLIAELAREGYIHSEDIHRRKDGTVIHIEYTNTMVVIDGRELVLGIDRDITARKRVEELRRSEEQFRLLFTHSPDAILLFDPHHASGTWPIIDCNEVACHMYGYPHDELIRQSVNLLDCAPIPANLALQRLEQIRSSGRLEGQALHQRKNGSVFPAEYAAVLIGFGDRELVMRIDRDITARKRAEELRRSEEQFRLLFTHSPDAILLFDPHHASGTWPIIDCNEVACHMYGYGREELIDMSVHLLEPAANRQDLGSALLAIRHARIERGESKAQRKDGSVFPVEYSSSLVTIDGRELVLGIDRDVTARKQAEEVQRRSAERLQHLHDISQAILAVQPSAAIALTTLRQVRQVVPCRRAHLSLIDDATGEATILVVDTEGEPQVKPGDHALFDVLGLRPELGEGKVVHIEDLTMLETEASELRALQHEGIHSLVFVPLTAQQKLIGALCLGADHPGRFAEDDVVISREVADLLAVALHNAQIYSKEQHARRIAETLQAAGLDLTQSLDLPVVLHHLLEHLGHLLPYDSANVMLLDDQGKLAFTTGQGYQNLESNPLYRDLRFDPGENTIFHTLLTEGRSILIPDTDANPEWERRSSSAHVRNWLGVPLISGGEVIGVYSVDKTVPGFFTVEHVQLAEAFAPHAALAIQNSRLFAALAIGRERQQRLSQQLLQVQESERRLLARELHDQVGQMLTALTMNLQMLMRSDNDDRLVDSIGLARQTLAVVRDLSFELRPPMLDDFGLASALRWYIDREARRAGYAAQLMAEELEGRLPANLESTCFRIVQEALTNVTRHAGASEVIVEVRQESDKLVVIVRDNGVGFDVGIAHERARSGNSLGLLSMRERAELVGGTLVIEPGSGGGSIVQACFPIADPSYERMSV